MGIDHYSLAAIARARIAELHAASLAQAAALEASPRHSVRVKLGELLIGVGRWLLCDQRRIAR